MRSLPILARLAMTGSVVALLGVFAVYAAGQWQPGKNAYPRQGIDVSHHQGAIDWPAVATQHVAFAYIKASEGGDHRDRRFVANWAGAAKAGIERGAYHYFTLCRDGAAQAANFIAAVPRDPEALAPAVDLEYLGNCTRAERLTGEAFHRELGIFLTQVEARFGKPVILYLTKEFDTAYGVSRRHAGPLWLRSLVSKPDFGARPWTIWQTSNFRRIKGIKGRVDWNVMR